MTNIQALRDRPFNAEETEQTRLMLSTFKDGSGQRVKAGFMPDYLAFERVTAEVLGGSTNEDKGIFDVDVPGGDRRKPWGVSCKMAAAQPPANNCWFMELSNSSKYFHDALEAAGVAAWTTDPQQAGPVVVATVEAWHAAARVRYDLEASKYLLLIRDSRWRKFQIAAFDIHILSHANPQTVKWRVEGRNGPSSLAGYVGTNAGEHRLWQWYANSGGQLKFYPPKGWEEWHTNTFELETPSVRGLKSKVDEYWPGKWPNTRC